MSDRERIKRRYVGSDDVCRYLGLARSTLYDYRRRGLIPHYRIGGRYRFRLDEVEDWMQARRQGGS